MCVCYSEVKKMTNLQELNVSGNQLTTLPQSLGCLTKLIVLHVHSNSLHSLPSFHDAVSLRVSTDHDFHILRLFVLYVDMCIFYNFCVHICYKAMQ